MPHGAAHDAAKHIAAALVRGQHAVGDEERRRAQMVGDDAVRRFLLAIGIDAGQIGDRLDQRGEQIDLVISGTRSSLPDDFYATVPTDAERTGNFTGLPPIYDPVTGQQFTGNMIPSTGAPG